MITRWFALLAVLLVTGCAKSSNSYTGSPAAEYDGDYYYGDESAEAAPTVAMESARRSSRGGGKSKKKSGARPAPRPAPAPSGAPQAVVIEEPDEAQPGPARMVHYDGWARLRVTKPTTAVDEIAQIATDAGGRVDRLTATQVTVRVPVEQFDEIWQQILRVGDVIDKSVRADDITDQYLATDLRTRTLRTMRDRLVRLLARAKTEEEKLALLEQITRVTEELDATESRLRTLADLASMSRISVDAVAREAFGRSARGFELAGFHWIRSLSPFNRSVYDSDKRISLPSPHEMVPLSKKGPYIAEGADGTVLWTMRVPNDPDGDAAFWTSAIESRIASEFTGAKTRDVGQWRCLSLDEPGSDEPYQWRICVKRSGKHLQVAQAYFPSPAQVVRFGDRVDDALAGGGAS
ncbi:MAG: DUF4349 domain-containing protein [Myxococcales bacterium]|nr:DUF4349 domain-containing protein [Myxococcales bacterium]